MHVEVRTCCRVQTEQTMVSERCYAFIVSIIKAMPCLCLGRDHSYYMPYLQSLTQEMLKQKLQQSWNYTAGVRLKAIDLFTNVGCAKGHYKILWYLPSEA